MEERLRGWHCLGWDNGKEDVMQLKKIVALVTAFAMLMPAAGCSEKEKSSMYVIGAKDIIEKILPVVDNFERGLATIPEGEEKSAFAEGMDKVYKQLVKTLGDAGVKPIEAVGQPFDPNFHNAVMHIEDENLGENVVAEEFQKGYVYRDSVVRHSMVKVAN